MKAWVWRGKRLVFSSTNPGMNVDRKLAMEYSVPVASRKSTYKNVYRSGGGGRSELSSTDSLGLGPGTTQSLSPAPHHPPFTPSTLAPRPSSPPSPFHSQ